MKKIIVGLVALIFVCSLAWLIISGYFFNAATTSMEMDPGISKNEIIIGTASAQTGHVGFFYEYLIGAEAYLNKINDQGGVYGRRIKLISYDDQYDPAKTVYYTQKLINEDKVFALFNFVGTPTVIKAVPMIESAQVPLLGIGSGAEVFRSPVKKYIFNLRASYHQEIDASIKGLVGELGLKRIAVFYQYDDYGFDGLKGAEISLAKYGLTPVATASYQRGTLDVEAALKVIKQSGAEAVVMVSVYGPAAKFIKLAKAENFKPIFQNLSFTGSEALAKELGADGDGVLITQVVPPPTEKNSLSGVNDYIDDLIKYYPEHSPTFSGLEGFVDAEILVEALHRAGPMPNRQTFIKTLESISNYPIGLDSSVSFSQTEHQGVQETYLTYIKDGKFNLFNDWQQFKNILN